MPVCNFGWSISRSARRVSEFTYSAPTTKNARCLLGRKKAVVAHLLRFCGAAECQPSTRRVCSSRISSAMLILDSFTSSANGACGRHERHDSAGIRLLTAESGWRSNLRKSTSPVHRQPGQRAHRNQCREAMAAPIVGENNIGILAAWRSFQAPISRSASSSTWLRSRAGTQPLRRPWPSGRPASCGG